MEKIICVQSESEIYTLLQVFSPYLTSLSSGQVDKATMAKKLSAYATVLKIERDEQYVAFAAFYNNDSVNKRAFLTMIAVSDSFRRQGYGKLILESVISYCKQSEMRYLALEVRKENLGAIDFYKSFDFNIMLEKDNCYEMELKLS